MDQIRLALLLDQVSNHANGLHRLNRYRSKTQNGERQNPTPNNRRKEKLLPARRCRRRGKGSIAQTTQNAS